jgi:hypothetical protein
MATTDIPEFVEFSPGDPIRSDDWNNIQRQIRNVVRGHKHSRPASTPPTDSSTEDVAQQIATEEIADLAVTATKLAAGAVTSAKLVDGSITNQKLGDNVISTNKLQDGAVTGQKLATNSVARANIQDDAINRPKLALQEVNSGNAQVSVGATTLIQVKSNIPLASSQVFFPMLTITGLAPGGGGAQVEAELAYRRLATQTGDTVDLMLRLNNTGALGATVTWRVMTFAP